jgi:hypothetical protein
LARFNLFETSSKEHKLGNVLETLFFADLVVIVISIEKSFLNSMKAQAEMNFEFEDEDDLAMLNSGKN